MPHKRKTSDFAALVVSFTLLVSIVVGFVACGSDDLFFPGEFPPTPTSQSTATAGSTATPTS